MKFLTPDKSTTLMRFYHKSGKVLLPMTLVSGGLYKLESHYYPVVAIPNVLQVAYHSYVSTSAVISDYIKPPKLNKLSRVLNMKCHAFASVGFLYYICKCIIICN